MSLWRQWLNIDILTALTQLPSSFYKAHFIRLQVQSLHHLVEGSK